MGAEVLRVDRVLEHQSRVVGRAVVVLERAAKSLGPEPRFECEVRLRPTEGLVHLGRAEQGQRVIDPEPDVHDLEPRANTLVDRDQKRQRSDEVRRDAHLNATLGHALEHEPDLAVLQVAKATVDHLARLARGSRRVVVLLEQGDGQTAQRGVPRDARTGDAATDDDEVVLDHDRRTIADGGRRDGGPTER